MVKESYRQTPTQQRKETFRTAQISPFADFYGVSYRKASALSSTLFRFARHIRMCEHLTWLIFRGVFFFSRKGKHKINVSLSHKPTHRRTIAQDNTDLIVSTMRLIWHWNVHLCSYYAISSSGFFWCVVHGLFAFSPKFGGFLCVCADSNQRTDLPRLALLMARNQMLRVISLVTHKYINKL